MVSGQDVLRERIARALWKHRYPGVEQAGPLADLALTDADAVIAALGLIPDVTTLFPGANLRRYITPWEQIEDDAEMLNAMMAKAIRRAIRYEEDA